MANVTCRSCGRRYDYSQYDCCPDCGAYNRPPRHEQVDADGTVRHLTDADYAKRKGVALGKVCFEEKECYEEKNCYEDEARNGDKCPPEAPIHKNPQVAWPALIAFLFIYWSRTKILWARIGMMSPFKRIVTIACAVFVAAFLAAGFAARLIKPLREKMRKNKKIMSFMSILFAVAALVMSALLVFNR